MAVRLIQPKMRSFLLYSNRENPDYIAARAVGDPVKIMILDALACVGKREATGNNDGLFIELLQQTVDGQDEREAYCIAGGMTMIAHAEIETAKKSPIFATEHCMTCWRSSPASIRIPRANLRPGDCAIWNHIGTDNGHFGIVVEVHDDHMILVEFNTTAGEGSSSKIIREGGGVYRTKRSYGTEGDMKLVGFLRPFP